MPDECTFSPKWERRKGLVERCGLGKKRNKFGTAAVGNLIGVNKRIVAVPAEVGSH